MKLTARAFKYGDDINTDYIISGKYKFKSTDMEAMAVHAMEELDPDYYAKVKPEGGFLVAGTNFGMGSSREQAPLVLIHSNTKAILAKSFARIFFRNAINTGLPVVEVDTDLIDDGDELEVDLEAGVVRDLTKGTDAGRQPGTGRLRHVPRAAAAPPAPRWRTARQGPTRSLDPRGSRRSLLPRAGAGHRYGSLPATAEGKFPSLNQTAIRLCLFQLIYTNIHDECHITYVT